MKIAIKIFTTAFTLFYLAGCEHLKIHENWYKAGVTQAMYATDWNQCKYETDRLVAFLPNNSPAAGYKTASTQKEVFESCLVSKGYEKVGVGQDRTAPGERSIGILFDDLSNTKRMELERNSGVIITVVTEDSPAWKANLIPGDVVIEINGKEIKNIKHASEVIQQLKTKIGDIAFKIIRKNSIRTINVPWNPS